MSAPERSPGVLDPAATTAPRSAVKLSHVTGVVCALVVIALVSCCIPPWRQRGALRAETLEPAIRTVTVTPPTTGPYAPCFTNSFNPGLQIITIAPATNSCIFYVGDPVRITSSTPIEVYRLVYDSQTSFTTNHASPLTLTQLPIGHYFVQSGSDRNEFVVLPSTYTTLTQLGHGDYWSLEGCPAMDAASDRAKPGWVRVCMHWSAIQITNGATYNWNAAWNGSAGQASEESNLLHWVGREKIVFNTDIPAWASTLSFTDFTLAFSNFLSAVYERYSNEVDVMQAINEPYLDTTYSDVFTNSGSEKYANMTSLLKMVTTAWRKSPRVGPSEGSPWAGDRGMALTAAGGNVYLDAVDFHDYWNKYPPPWGAPDDPTNGIPLRCLTNLAAVVQTNIFMTELGFQGGSAIGYPAKDDAHDGEHSNPRFGWSRGLTRAIRTVVLYMQTNSVILGLDLSPANIEIAGFDGNGAIIPKTSAILMTGHWLNHSKPLTNWISGNLHFARSVWANGRTNTFVWSSENSITSTNLGVYVSDIWSQRVTGAITEEPVIAWDWIP